MSHSSAFLSKLPEEVADNEGMTALHLAARNDHPEIVKFLLEAGSSKERCLGEANCCFFLNVFSLNCCCVPWTFFGGRVLCLSMFFLFLSCLLFFWGVFA